MGFANEGFNMNPGAVPAWATEIQPPQRTGLDYVYFLFVKGGISQNGMALTTQVKIGHSRSIVDRMKALANETRQPGWLISYCNGGQLFERIIHSALHPSGHIFGEWFNATDPVGRLAQAVRYNCNMDLADLAEALNSAGLLSLPLKMKILGELIDQTELALQRTSRLLRSEPYRRELNWPPVLSAKESSTP